MSDECRNFVHNFGNCITLGRKQEECLENICSCLLNDLLGYFTVRDNHTNYIKAYDSLLSPLPSVPPTTYQNNCVVFVFRNLRPLGVKICT